MVQVLKAGSKGLMSLDEWKRSPEFRACTDKMQRWLLAVIETDGDYTKATLTAYECKSPRQAQIFSYAVRDVPRVKAALDLYLGKTPLDVLLEEVNDGIRHADRHTVSYQRLCAQKERLLRQILGLAPVKDDDEPEIPRPAGQQDSRVPAGATPLIDGNGVVRGYRTADGQYVQLEVAR